MTATPTPSVVDSWGLGAPTRAFGEQVSDHWQRPSAADYPEAIRTALPRATVPCDLEDAMESDECDEALRLSHQAGFALERTKVRPPVFT